MIHRLLKGLLVFLPTGDHIRVISDNSFFRQEIYVVRQVQPIVGDMLIYILESEDLLMALILYHIWSCSFINQEAHPGWQS